MPQYLYPSQKGQFMSLIRHRLPARLGVALTASAVAAGLAVPAASAAEDTPALPAEDTPDSGAAALSGSIENSLEGDIDLDQTVASLTGTDWGKLISTTAELSSGTVSSETILNLFELISGEDVTVASAVDSVAGSIASGSSDDNEDTPGDTPDEGDAPEAPAGSSAE
jgi:hypothetical protein